MYGYNYDDYLIDQANIHMGGSEFMDDNWQTINFDESEEDWSDYEEYLKKEACFQNGGK